MSHSAYFSSGRYRMGRAGGSDQSAVGAIEFFYLICVCFCLWAPKLNVIGFSFSQGGTGIRIDDVLLAMAMAVLLAQNTLRRKLKVDYVVVAATGFVMVNLFSSIIAVVRGEMTFQETVLYGVRLFEYLVGFMLGKRLAMVRGWRLAITGCLFFLVVFSILEKADILSFSRFGESRLSANTGGPYELAAMAGLLYIHFLSRGRFIFALTCLGLLVMTASRITFVAVIVAHIYWAISSGRSLRLLLIPIGSLCAVVITSFILSGDLIPIKSEKGASLSGRFETALAGGFFKEAGDTMAEIPMQHTRDEYLAENYGKGIFQDVSTAGEASGMFRVHRWYSLVLITTSSTDRLLFGNGPGFAERAVDGNYIRVFAEGGLLGVLMFVVFIGTLWRRAPSPTIRAMLVVLLVTALFIDIFIAYKAMFLFLFLYGVDVGVTSARSNIRPVIA
jgi:hypothetical protein